MYVLCHLQIIWALHLLVEKSSQALSDYLGFPKAFQLKQSVSKKFRTAGNDLGDV